jgi:hypothetical protein
MRARPTAATHHDAILKNPPVDQGGEIRDVFRAHDPERRADWSPLQAARLSYRQNKQCRFTYVNK